MNTAILLFVLTLCTVSFNSFGQINVDDTVAMGGFSVEQSLDSKIDADGFSVNIPVKIKDDVVYLANVGYIISDGESDISAPGMYDSNGHAEYMYLGGEARKVMLDKEWLEGTLSARYGLRTGGTTEWSDYSQLNGKLYNSHEGLNVGVGVNFVKKFDRNRRALVIGVKYEANLEEEDGRYMLNISYRN